LEKLSALRQKTYQRRLGFGFQNTPEMRERWELAAAKRWLRASILYVGGKNLCFVANAKRAR
jgi:hypothetical protein